MNDREKVVEFNKYIITLFFGVIAFINVELLSNLYDISSILLVGVNMLTFILLVSSLLLLYASAPKSLTILRILFPKKYNDEKIKIAYLKLERIDICISTIVWILVFLFTMIASIWAL